MAKTNANNKKIHKRHTALERSLESVDKAANNVVVLLKTRYIYTKKQELCTANTYEHNLLNERSVINRHRCHVASK